MWLLILGDSGIYCKNTFLSPIRITNGLWAHNTIFVELYNVFTRNIIIQLGHNFVQLHYHDTDIIVSWLDH